MKGVSTIIAAVLVVTIAIGLTSTAYIWGAPLIQKRQEASVSEKVFSQFSQSNLNSLPKMIEDVANNRGVRSFTVGADGLWIFNPAEDSIEFSFPSKTSNIAADTQSPVSLTTGVQCTGASPPNSPSPATGALGQDSSSVVCARAISSQGFFNITYKVWFRELDDNPFSPKQGFKIDLEQDAGQLTSTGRTVTITFSDSTQQVVDGKTLITKKIKILLI